MKAKLGNIYGILSILSLLLYTFFFSLSRKQFAESLLTYTGLFILLWAIYWVCARAHVQKIHLLPQVLGKAFKGSTTLAAIFLLGLAARLVLLHQTPNLSQDFFRFIWDGHQLLNGFNPYLSVPDQVMASGATHIPNAAFLQAKMGSLSAGNYTNYPPLNQLFFAAAAYLGGDNIQATMVWMRVLIIAGEIGVFIYGVKLLRFCGKNPYLILLYFLNPFIIIELTGNLHWEGMMALLMLMGVYYLLRYQPWKSALFIGWGVLVKLMPLLILPLLWKFLGTKRALGYYVFIGLIIGVGFLPFYQDVWWDHYSSSVGLWFGKFEFNASLYYLVRWIGFEITGYNIIATAGKVLPVITFLGVISLAIFRKNAKAEVLLTSIVFSFFIYLVCATTVHPWYLSIPLLFSIFTRYRFMLVWSITVFFSYHAYSEEAYTENLYWVALEYLLVVAWFVWEVFKPRSINTSKPEPAFVREASLDQ